MQFNLIALEFSAFCGPFLGVKLFSRAFLSLVFVPLKLSLLPSSWSWSWCWWWHRSVLSRHCFNLISSTRGLFTIPSVSFLFSWVKLKPSKLLNIFRGFHTTRYWKPFFEPSTLAQSSLHFFLIPSQTGISASLVRSKTTGK